MKFISMKQGFAWCIWKTTSIPVVEKRAGILALALTFPLLLYGVPYAYATTMSSSYELNSTFGAPANTQGFEAWVTCDSGDYVTGGGFSISFTTLTVWKSYSGSPAHPPDTWNVAVNNPSAQSQNFIVWAMCQKPITVAGIGVPEFGSLYVAIALGAVLYFLLSKRFTRSPTVSE
jgi:hypothetical protein